MAFPEDVKDDIGYALHLVQIGETPRNAKPLTGAQFPGVSVMEIVQPYDSDTYRAVYTAKFEGVVYVLYCFQKKSKSGVSTPRQDINLILQRFKDARELHVKEKSA